MPNVHLFHKSLAKEINKSEMLKEAWSYIRQGLSRKDSFKKAWSKYSLNVYFWTSAKPEDIKWSIKTCQSEGIVRRDLLRKWDSSQIKTPLDWVSYHLRRNGFLIEEELKPSSYTVKYEIPKL